jgi:hypothetical protein
VEGGWTHRHIHCLRIYCRKMMKIIMFKLHGWKAMTTAS